VSSASGLSADLFPSIELAVEIDALKAQLAAIMGAPRQSSPIRRPFAITYRRRNERLAGSGA
jgi:hypothetical protein